MLLEDAIYQGVITALVGTIVFLFRWGNGHAKNHEVALDKFITAHQLSIEAMNATANELQKTVEHTVRLENRIEGLSAECRRLADEVRDRRFSSWAGSHCHNGESP